MAATKKNLTTAEQQARRRPTTIDEMVPDEETSDEEEAALADAAQASGPAKLAQAMNPQSAMVQGAPEWAIIPPDLKIPPNVEVSFMRVPVKDGSEIQLILWELGVRDERMGRARADAGGPGVRMVEEMSKQMFRAIDGKVVTWANPLIIESTWERIGAKYRNVIGAYYMKLHQLDEEERVDFFVNRVVARRSV